jgi:hypothetical protein
MILTLALSVILAAALAGPLSSAGLPAQDAPQQAKKDKGKKAREVFVLSGTVFTQQGYGLPGAQVSVRRTGEKKVRGKAMADRRGEFGVRLRDAGEYEVTVQAKGYQAQVRKFSAQLGSGTNFVFRMQPASGGQP